MKQPKDLNASKCQTTQGKLGIWGKACQAATLISLLMVLPECQSDTQGSVQFEIWSPLDKPPPRNWCLKGQIRDEALSSAAKGTGRPGLTLAAFLFLEEQYWVLFPLPQGMATHSSTLAWRIPWTEEPGGLQSIGLPRVRHDWSDLAFTHTVLHSLNFIWRMYITLVNKKLRTIQVVFLKENWLLNSVTTIVTTETTQVHQLTLMWNALNPSLQHVLCRNRL